MSISNTTLDHDEKATAVDPPLIKSIMSQQTGKHYDARKFIVRKINSNLIKLRSTLHERLRRGKSGLVCSCCQVPVFLRCSERKAFFFRHKHENGECPFVTRRNLDNRDLEAIKYMGARESKAHKDFKDLIQKSLEVDQQFSNIKAESRWTSKIDTKSYRQPDVQAYYNKIQIAFEVELSTTFLSVVVDRKIFYQDQSGLLIWFLPRFDPYNRRMTDEDIFVSNNQNALLVDYETVRLSEEQKQFIVKCVYRQPELIGEHIETKWVITIVPFKQLTQDIISQRTYFFNYEAEREKLDKVVASSLKIKNEKQLAEFKNNIRNSFFELWRKCNEHWINRNGVSPTSESIINSNSRNLLNIEWQKIRYEFERLELFLPQEFYNSEFYSGVNSVLSAKFGRPIGYKYDKFKQVGMNLFNHHKYHLLMFGKALKFYGTKKLFEYNGDKLKWEMKRDKIRKGMKTWQPEYRPNEKYENVFRFLFPDIYSDVDKSVKNIRSKLPLELKIQYEMVDQTV